MFRFKIYLCSALLMLGSLLMSERAEADCSASVTPLNFGEINPVTATGHVDFTATITYDCSVTLALLSYINVCIQIGLGPLDANVESRFLGHSSGTTDTLLYNVYSDSSHTSIWGNVFGSSNPPVVVQYGPYVLGLRSVSGSRTIYGRIFGSNPFMQKAIGDYFSTLDITVRASSITVLGLLSCTGTPSSPVSLSVSAEIIPACDFSAMNVGNLAFGSHDSFQQNVFGQTQLQVRCSMGTSYDIELNAGQNPVVADDVNTRRMRGESGNPDNTGSYVPYNLYKDSARSKVWGMGENMEKGTGTGSVSSHPIYGKVPGTNYTVGNYRDTITVTVSY